MLPQYEYQLWRQLKNAFEVKRMIFVGIAAGMDDYHLEQYATMEDALEVAEGERVFLEPSGMNWLSEIPKGDIVLITGNTDHDNTRYATADEMYKIDSPQRSHLYPTDAAAIALAIRYGQ